MLHNPLDLKIHISESNKLVLLLLRDMTGNLELCHAGFDT